MGIERRSRSEDTFENKYLFYPRNPLIIYPLSPYLQMSPMWKMGLATALPYRSLRLTPAPSARRRGTSKPSQEVVIQLFCFHYHSYKQVCRVIIKTKGVDFSTPSCFVLGWKMGLEPTTLGTTILYSNQLSYIHHLDLISQIGCKYRVFIVSLQIYLQKFFRK